MTYSEAHAKLLDGCRIAREGWNGKDQWIILINPGNACFTHDGNHYPMQRCLGLKNAQGNMQPGWVPSQGDLFADDWVVFES